MKNLFLVLICLASFTSDAQTINEGDNLTSAYQKLDKPYFFKAPNFTAWAEGADMLLIGAEPNPNDCDFLFIALKDTTLIGIFKTAKPNIFLFDTAGNSILNSTSAFFVLPLWTVKAKTKITAADKTILSVLDKLYEQTMQANDGLPDEKLIKKYQQFKTDTTLANRHIALLFDNYQTIITETAAKGKKAPANICVPLMKTLSGECLSLYNTIPAIVCIYMGEALQSAGMIDKAREHFKISLQFYPKSIPLLVYNYQLEKNADKKQELLNTLKEKYPKHWMVQGL